MIGRAAWAALIGAIIILSPRLSGVEPITENLHASNGLAEQDRPEVEPTSDARKILVADIAGHARPVSPPSPVSNC